MLPPVAPGVPGATGSARLLATPPLRSSVAIRAKSHAALPATPEHAQQQHALHRSVTTLSQMGLRREKSMQALTAFDELAASSP